MGLHRGGKRWFSGALRFTAKEQEEAATLLESLTESEVNAGKPDSLAEKGQARTRALTQLCLAVFNLSEFSYVD